MYVNFTSPVMFSWASCTSAGVWLGTLLYKLRSVQNTGTCYPGQGWFVRNRCTWQIQPRHFFNFQFLCGFGWEPCRTATMHSAPCHCSLLSEWGCSVLIRQSNLPVCLAEGQQEETLSGIHATELVKLADKIDEICISGKFSVQEPSKWKIFTAYLWVALLYFSPESRLISGGLVVLKIN